MIKKIFLLFCFSNFYIKVNAKSFSQNNNYNTKNIKKKDKIYPKYTVGFNITQFIITYGLSLIFRRYKEQYFLPLHFNGSLKYNSSFAFYGGFIYRRDTFGTFSNYNEFIILGGLRYSPFISNNVSNLYLATRIGYGYAKGNFTNYIEINHFNKGRDFIFYRENGNFYEVKGELYQCHELALESEVGYSIIFSDNHINIDLGLGILCLIPIYISQVKLSRDPYWGWSLLGMIMHRFVPIVNISIGYSF